MKKFVLVFSVGLFLFSGCSKQPLRKEQILKLSFQKEPVTLDPRKGGDIISSTMQFMLFEGLTRMTERSTTEMALAYSIEISNDLKTYIFHLKDEIYWSDGNPITAYDIEYAWKTMLTPGFPAPSANLLYCIKNAEEAKKGKVLLQDLGIHVIDEKTFEVSLEYPCSYFLELTSFCALFPVPHHVVQNDPNWANKEEIVSNGPFILKNWKKGAGLSVLKNGEYWDKKNVFLDQIQIDFIEDEMTAFQMYEKNLLDFVGTPFSELPMEAVPELKKSGEIHYRPIAGTTMCSFNTQRFPFNNLNIRKAFAYAISRKEIVEHITNLQEEVAYEIVPSLIKAEKQKPLFEDGDATLAKQLLEKGLSELGRTLEDLKDLTLVVANKRKNIKIAEAIQQQWQKNLNVFVKLEPLEFRIFLDKLRNHDFFIGQSNWVAQFNDPVNILNRFAEKTSPTNETGWEHPEYKELLKAAVFCTNPIKRQEILHEAETFFIKEMPLTPLFHWNYAYLKKPNVKNLYISPIGSFHFGHVALDVNP